jgi:hypothetical protein
VTDTSEDVVVNGPVLEADAEKIWQAGADSLRTIKGAIPTLASSDFGLMPRAADMLPLYEKACQELGEYIEDGAEEFLWFEETLLKTILVYGRSHGATVEDIARIRKELEN